MPERRWWPSVRYPSSWRTPVCRLGCISEELYASIIGASIITMIVLPISIKSGPEGAGLDSPPPAKEAAVLVDGDRGSADGAAHEAVRVRGEEGGDPQAALLAVHRHRVIHHDPVLQPGPPRGQ